MQYINHNKNHSHGFTSLVQRIGELRQQLVQPDTSLFQVAEPETQTISLHKALHRFAMEGEWLELDQALHRIELVVALLNCPILGVAGLLNSGKSSFVASYLSAAGRRRVLRGDTSHCGTQRFVFWLPDQWRQNQAVWTAMLDQISELFGGRYEMLDAEPQQAHRQYNQLNEDQQIEVPLIATDPGLHNLALLDCPDVQRTDDQVSAAKREAFLRQAAPICSAFLFVTTQKNIADEKARKVAYGLREMMPDVPFHLVMNQVEPDRDILPDQFLRDKYIKQLIDSLLVDHFYIAYHYKIRGWEKLTPAALHALALRENKADQVPAAWRVSGNPAENALARIQPDRYLIHLPDNLQASELGLPQILSHWHRFQARKRQALSNLLHKVQADREAMQALHQDLLDFCYQHTTDQANNPRLPLSAELIKKLHRGMEAGAPLYIRPLLLSGRKMHQIMTSSVDAIKKMFARVRLIDQDALYALKSQALNAEHLSQSIRQSKKLTALQAHLAPAARADLQQAWDQIIQKTDLSAIQLADQLDDQKIANSAANAWKNIPLMAKVSAITQGMLALLVSLSVVLLIPFGSPAAAILAQASLPELIAAAGLGSLSGWGFASTSLARNLEQELFLPYFSNLFYFACDAFGLPRQLDAAPAAIILNNQQYALRDTSQTSPPDTQPGTAWARAPRYWRKNDPAFARLEQTIQQINQRLAEKTA